MNKERLLARAKELEREQGYGDVFLIDDFIEEVKNGYFINYDGFGCFGDWTGKADEMIDCNVKWLEENRKDYLFVFWYNK